MTKGQIVLAGLVALGVFALLNARSSAAAVSGSTIVGTDGRVYELYQDSAGVIRDQYGKVWV